MPSLDSLFNIVFSNYLKDTISGRTGPQIGTEFMQTLEPHFKDYKIKWSNGISNNKAELPWLALMDPNITITATEGYYIVFLFKADMSGVYLSLNQGWTFFNDSYGRKIGKKKIKTIADYWREKLPISRTDLSTDPIHLAHSRTKFGAGYELGHICGKFYDAATVPSETVLLKDLQEIAELYTHLYNEIKVSGYESTNKKILIDDDLNVKVKETTVETDLARDIENNLKQLETNSKLKITHRPDQRGKTKKNSRKGKRNIDFETKSRINKRVGHAGELMVLKYEKEYLTSRGKKDLAKKVEHVSKTKGDGLGYDILSFDYLTENEKYIEVKTTTGNKKTPFYLTETELHCSREEKDKFYLYRVFNFNPKLCTGELYTVEGNLDDNLILVPTQYRVDFS
ncbi:MrcB family domain-containing protein [Bacillus toyonensis]|uniref:MrcB family domain-containing protein n=1 Tax=Bacillus toyonensis TaxID=155322 RepID=UPI0015CF6FC2|nr:DUF3578 domain-containing protein [Bacillus toyonensis]